MILVYIAVQVAAAMPLLERGEFADAQPILQQACQAGESNACYLLGRTLLALDQYERALAVLSALQTTDPAPWRVFDAMATAAEALRRTSEAESLYRRSIAGNQDKTPEPRYHYGRFLIREGRAKDAAAILKPGAVKFPKYEPLRFELGRALYHQEQWEAAARELEAAPGLDEARRLRILAQKRQAAN